MRIRFGVAMPAKGGRTAVVGCEVLERQEDGRTRHDFVVGHVERVVPHTIEAAKDRVAELVGDFADLRPCVLVDVGTAQGAALRTMLKGAWDESLHRPHAYPGTGDRKDLFSTFLLAYGAGRVRFRAGLPHRAELDRALVNYMAGPVRESGVELSSEDEALVIALGLALYWPRHGAPAGKEEAPSEEGAS